jgi:hypothetical protein
VAGDDPGLWRPDRQHFTQSQAEWQMELLDESKKTLFRIRLRRGDAGLKAEVSLGHHRRPLAQLPGWCLADLPKFRQARIDSIDFVFELFED